MDRRTRRCRACTEGYNNGDDTLSLPDLRPVQQALGHVPQVQVAATRTGESVSDETGLCDWCTNRSNALVFSSASKSWICPPCFAEEREMLSAMSKADNDDGEDW